MAKRRLSAQFSPFRVEGEPDAGGEQLRDRYGKLWKHGILPRRCIAATVVSRHHL